MGGGGLGEGGGGGGAGEGVTGDDSITLGDRWRRPEEHNFSLSRNCCEHLWRSRWSYEGIALEEVK